MHGVTAMSRRVRDAIGPDAGDKETGLVGAGGKGGKDRLYVRVVDAKTRLCVLTVDGQTWATPRLAARSFARTLRRTEARNGVLYRGNR